MQNKRRITRRTVLQGAGAISIGFPFLEEMLVSTARASTGTAEIPVRAFNVFFGLGIPAPLQTEGFDGVLEPLKPLAEKLLIMRNVDQIRCDESGINAHFDGASGAFTAEPPDGEAKSGGPSIDQLVKDHWYPQGLPAGMVPSLVAGTFFRRSRVSRYVHSYKRNGTIAGAMQERPRDLFERVFGAIAVSGDAHDARRERLKRSVLDSVVDQYRFYTSVGSPLGAASRARVADHLDRIREFEQRAYEMRDKPSDTPALPERSRLAHGGQADPGGQGIDMPLDDLLREWQLMADLYALAIETDRARFGALTFLAAGERLRIKGDYHYEGRLVYQFDDAKDLNATGDKGCSHEFWHQFNPQKTNQQLRSHAHMKMSQVAYFLKRLDATKEANGRSILENSLVTISTESGDGRHNDVKRELSGVFHAISGGNGRFKTGGMMDLGQEGIDVYNTMLSVMGVEDRLGPPDREMTAVDAIVT